MTSLVTAVLSLAAALVLASCAGFGQPSTAGPAPALVEQGPYSEATADALMRYARSLAYLDAGQRTLECHRVLATYHRERKVAALFHLFVAQQAARMCGDPVSTAREVRAMAAQSTDLLLRHFLSFQLLVAERQAIEAAQRRDLEDALRKARQGLSQALSRQRQSISQARNTYRRMKSRDAEARQLKQKVDELKSVEQGLSRSVRSRDAEARQLKEKLDALKSIEQEINETEKREDHD